MAWTQNASQAGKYVFETAGKYVDRDIELTIPAGSIGSVTGTGINGTGSATINSVSVGTKTSGKYPLTGSAAITGSTSGTATATGGTAGWITESTTKTGTVTGKISGTASLNYNMTAAAATVTGSATVKPNGLTAASGNATVSGNATTTAPESGYYVAATPSTAASTTISQSKSGLTAGYLGNLSEISTSGSVTGGSGSKYYIPITSGAIAAAAEDPGTSYTENSTAISSGGWLKIDAGWIPNTKISLATLIGDDINEVTTTTASSNMLSGFRAYDKDGNVLIGNIPTKTSSNLSVSGATVTVPSGYYATNASKTIANAATPALSITDQSNNLITPKAISGDSSKYDIITSVTGKTSYGTAGYSTTSGLAAATDSSAKVGQIAASTSKVGNSDITSGSTLTAGSTVTISAGYYPTDREFTAPTAAGAVGTTTVQAGLTLGTAPSNYTNPTLVTSKENGKTYIELQGTASADKGKVVSSVTSPSVKYLEAYTGTFHIS